MAIKTYTINGAGQRLKYYIPFANTPDSSNNSQSNPGGTLETNTSSGRIGTTTNGIYDEKKGAIANVMRYQFTTSADPASTITLTSLKWTGSFTHVNQGTSDADLSVPRCLITTNSWPEDYLDIWGYDTKYGKVNSGVITISGNTAITSGDVPIYDKEFNQFQLNPNTTYYIFVFDNHGYPRNWGDRLFRTENGSLVVTTEVETYANIGEPSNINAAPYYVRPGDSLTVTWTKAEDGTNNPVKDYTLTWKVGSLSKTITGITAASAEDPTVSYNITMPNEAIRGASISCSIQAIPTQSGYGSEVVTNSAIAKINSLPSAPEVTPSQTILPSTGGSVSFTLSGSDPDRQSISFKCDGEPITLTDSKIEIKGITKTTTFSFQINDGLEDGPITKIRIEVNSKPVFDIEADIKQLTARFKITPRTGRASDYTYILDYVEDSKTQSKTLGTTKETSYVINNIRDYGVPAGTSFSFRIKRNDGIESYEISRDGSTTPVMPSYKGINHSSNHSNDELWDRFDNEMIPLFDFDGEDVPFTQVQVIVGNNSQIYPIDQGNPHKCITLNEATLSLFPRGSKDPIEMTMIFGYKDDEQNNYFFKQYYIKNAYTRVLNTINGLKMKDFNLFKSTPTFSFAFSNNQTLLYGLTSSPEKFKLIFEEDGKKVGEIDEVILRPSESSNDNTLSYNIPGSSLYEALKNELTEGQHNIKLKLGFYNNVSGMATGEEYLIITRNPLIDTPNEPSLFINDIEANQWNHLLQGMKIENAKFWYNAYTQDLTAQFYIQRVPGGTWEKYGNPISSHQDGEISHDTSLAHSFQPQLLATIGAVSNSYTPQVKVRITSQNVFVESDSLTLKTVEPLVPPTISIVSGIYENEKVKIGYTIINNKPTDATLDWKYGIELWIDKTKKDSFVLEDENGEISFDGAEIFKDKVDSVSVQLVAAATATAKAVGEDDEVTFSSDKAFSNSYTIFNIMPTVSYRKNRLGINSKIDDKDDKNYILKIAPSGSSTNVIALQTRQTQTEIVEGKEVEVPIFCKINLDNTEGTGHLINFIIDCGTWGT